MARYPLPTFEPDTQVPFALRLAQFLLGASDQVQQYGTNVEQQGQSALRAVDTMERSADRKSAIDRQTQQDAMVNADRARAAADREQAAKDKAAGVNTTNQFYQSLAKLYPNTQLPQIDNPSNLDPNAQKFLLEKLIPKPYEPPSSIAPGHGIRNPQGGYDVPIPAEPKDRRPQTVSPGAGVWDEASQSYKVPIPAAEKEPRAPVSEEAILGAAREALVAKGIANPTQGQIQTESMNIRERLGKSSAAQINLSASERDKNAEQENAAQLGRQIREMVASEPGMIGGPLGSTGRWNTIKMKFNAAPEKFGAILKGTQTLKAMLVHELTGANIGPSDQKVYMNQMPDAETNSDQEFQANLDATLGNIQRLQGIRRQIQGTRGGGGGGAAPTAESFINQFVK